MLWPCLEKGRSSCSTQTSGDPQGANSPLPASSGGDRPLPAHWPQSNEGMQPGFEPFLCHFPPVGCWVSSPPPTVSLSLLPCRTNTVRPSVGVKVMCARGRARSRCSVRSTDCWVFHAEEVLPSRPAPSPGLGGPGAHTICDPSSIQSAHSEITEQSQPVCKLQV